ncbi:DUF1415 domain-containing protein [Congregibacter brevis]|uniref:DUF1415 domain-containing protein n=1 Tax=Congregibacter brevis TaxID=3081201 RepID=A0ABZ0IGW6_9GAMM|nr:DUF1415 domain-containing protein [Congregibacter sp. IMCC45268]
MAFNLCPFAKRELDRGSVAFTLSDADDEEALLTDLAQELQRLEDCPEAETVFIVHPKVLNDFYDFNDFLGRCDALLKQMKLEGIYQIASFHPHYQFAGTELDDAENYSNRSPYPMLHLLREESVERAIAGHPDIASVPADNIRTLNRLGRERLQSLLQSCVDE